MTYVDFLRYASLGIAFGFGLGLGLGVVVAYIFHQVYGDIEE